MKHINRKIAFISLVFISTLLLPMSVSATEIESGHIKATSTGSVTENIGFRPDYIEFITAQQIESTDFSEADPENNDCPDNVNGWSEGSALFDSTGVEKQFSIGMFRSSDSTNGHITASSTNHVIRNVYTSQDGNECGRLEVAVTDVNNNGFDVNIQQKYSNYDEIIRYKAYQFPDNMGFEAGMIEVNSEGTIDVSGLGFRPANLHFRAGQQITSKNSVSDFWRDPAGRSKGYTTLDSAGNVVDQQSIGTASSSDSTNAHRSIASDEYVINTVYVDQNANLMDSGEPSRLEAKVTGADDDGFTLQVDNEWSSTNEIILYRAWGFSYYDFDIGYRVISDSNYVNWDTNEPNDAGDGEDCAEANWNGDKWNDMDCTDNPHEGLCEYPDGTYNTTSSMTWDSARNKCQSWGGHLAIINDNSENQYIYNNFGNAWIGYYQPSGSSEPAGGWRWIEQGEFNTGFEPDAIDIYAEQQIENINDEVLTPSNSGCDNAGGWSNGFYETDDDRQWSLSTGRTSDSQDSHRYGASNSEALMNLYNYDGNDCGNFNGEVTSVGSTGFQMSFNMDNNFVSNYGSEMVYYRALDFQLAPPQIESIEFYNASDDHKFGVVANISEGSNDISTCDITAESDIGNDVSYSGTATSINSTYSQCRYEWIRYDDHSNWEDRHDNNDELMTMNVTVNASDVDGLSSQDSDTNTFPNHGPEPVTIDFTNYTDAHAFNVSAVIEDVDADNPSEIDSCSMEFSDGDGNTVPASPSINYAYGTDQSECFYSSVNAKMVTGNLDNGFTPKESINVSVDFQDHHSVSNSSWNTNVIPNSPPVINIVQPKNGESVLKEEPGLIIQVTDPEGDDFQRIEYRDDISGNTIADLNPPPQQFEYNETWGPLDLGTYYWEVEVWDKWGSTNVSNIKFERVISTVYRVQHQIDYDYSSLIIEDNGQGFFFLEADVDTNNRTVTTYLESPDLTAEFMDTGLSQKTYEVDTGDPERFHIRVRGNQPGEHELKIVTEDDSVSANTTDTLPVYVRESIEEGNEIPGLTLPYLALILIISSLLYFALL